MEIIFGAQVALRPVEALIELLDAAPDYTHMRLRQAQLDKCPFSLELYNYDY